MCGIAAVLRIGDGCELDRARIGRMCEVMAHRGPDGSGSFVEDGVALGMRRLAIIDAAGGSQPIFNEDRSVVAVFNGELYNFRELRAELSRAGHRFRSHSDGEVIVHGYEQWGIGLLQRLNGMFAIVLYDLRARRAYLARDHVGIKPLYYSWDGRCLVAGSEVKALLASGLVDPRLDLDALAELVAWEYIPTPGTLLHGVHKLEPGTWLRLDLPTGRLARQRYWNLPEACGENARSDAEWLELLHATLMGAVRRQMVSDVALGAFLSGGVDSSLIAAFMGTGSTFSIGFEDPSYDELEHARRVASLLGVDHRSAVAGAQCLDLFDELLEHLDDPIADSSIFPTYLVSRLARGQVKVALSGDGADELFGGYETFVADELARRYRRLPARLRCGLIEPAVRGLRPRPAKKGLVNKAIRFVQGLQYPERAGHARWRMYLSQSEAAELFTADVAGAWTRPLDAHVEQLYRRAGSRPSLDRALYVELLSFLSDDILPKLDRMSMAVSLEARVPFLDREVVELAFRMPPRLKIRGGRTKWGLKKVAARHLPRATIRRPKEGFSAPLKHWIAGAHRPLMDELLDEQRLASEGIFRVDAVRRLKREHLAGQCNHAHRLWTLMVVQAWQRRWLQAGSATLPGDPQDRPVAVASG